MRNRCISRAGEVTREGGAGSREALWAWVMTWTGPGQAGLISVVLARLQAVSRAKPGLIRPGQAGPNSRPEDGFGLARDFRKPKPAAQAAALLHNQRHRSMR